MIRGATFCQRGASATEYTLIAAVIGVAALAILGRFGGALGSRYSTATDEVERTRPGKVVKGGEPAPQTPKVPDGETLHAEPDALGSSSTTESRRIGVGGVKFDLSTVIWLGIAIVAAAVTMMTKVFKAAHRQEKKEHAEWKDGTE